MEIKVGEYVRTPLGISKYLGECDDMPGFYKFDKLDEELWFGDIADVIHKDQLNKIILKHSSNIIDLIEVGDYVNGEQIDFINISKVGNKRLLIRDNIYFFDKYSSIKSIVTKEQFKEMEYKV